MARPRHKSQPGKQEPSASKFTWYKGLAVGAAALIAGLGAVIADAGKLASAVRSTCVEWGYCDPGSLYINAGIFPGNPESGAFEDLLENAQQVLSDFTAAWQVGPDFKGLELHRKLNPSMEGSINGTPYQIAIKDIGYWSPEEGISGWTLGFPIIEIIASEKGKAVDITSFEIEVLQSHLDDAPYVQLAATYDKPLQITLINESIHTSLDVELQFSIGDEFERCEEKVKDINPSTLEHSALVSPLIGEMSLDLSTQISLIVENYEDFPYDGEEIVPSVPAYGAMSASHANGSQTSFFCADIPLLNPGTGGGYIEINKSAIIALDHARAPYRESYPMLYRIDSDETSYRTALLFASDKSAVFDFRIHLKSFDRTIYTTDTIRAHIFTPSDTFSRLGEDGLDLAKLALKPL